MVGTVIPWFWMRNILCIMVKSFVSTKLLCIRIQNYFKFTRLTNTNLIICITLRGMKIENKDARAMFKNNYFVTFMFETCITWTTTKPTMFFLGLIHSCIKGIKELVFEQFILCKIPLPP